MYARSEKALHSKAIKVGLSFSRPSLLQIITAQHFFIVTAIHTISLREEECIIVTSLPGFFHTKASYLHVYYTSISVKQKLRISNFFVPYPIKYEK